ncbi:MAG: nucleotidyltransferase family protein [Burkholderiaceae bacterium]|nr:nucleotidyltransferase family protein [Burkholderiaceae bacterium]
MSASSFSHRARIEAVLLAAGSSTRMRGPNKLMARLDGVPLVCRALQVLRDAGFASPIVVLGHDANRIRALLGACEAAHGARLIEHHGHASGQQGSVVAGLAAVDPQAPAVMIMPADMPLLRPSDLRALVAAFDARAPGVEALVPYLGDRRGNPVIVAPQAVAAVLAAPEGGMRRYIDAHPQRVARFAAPNDHYTVDVDTPEALGELARRGAMRLDWSQG